MEISSFEFTPPPTLSDRPVWMERQWITIDVAGTGRNILSAIQTAVKATAVATAIFSMQIFAGVLITYNAVKYTLPNAYKEFKTTLTSDTQEGQVSSSLSGLGQIMYMKMGLGLFFLGAVTLLTKIIENPLINQLITGAAYFLGGLCVVRGAVMLGRALYSLAYLIPFQSKLKTVLANQDSDLITEFLSKELGDEKQFKNFERRVGSTAAHAVKTYFEKGGDLDEILKIVDKGLFTQFSKQTLYILISTAMIIGGMFSLMSTGGLGDLASSALISAISWTVTEFEFLIFDSSAAFNWLVDKAYTPSKELCPIDYSLHLNRYLTEL